MPGNMLAVSPERALRDQKPAAAPLWKTVTRLGGPSRSSRKSNLVLLQMIFVLGLFLRAFQGVFFIFLVLLSKAKARRAGPFYWREFIRSSRLLPRDPQWERCWRSIYKSPTARFTRSLRSTQRFSPVGRNQSMLETRSRSSCSASSDLKGSIGIV